MATIVGFGGGGLPDGITLSTGQTGNAVSTNVVDRGGGLEAAMVEITTTVGATPTVTVDVQGSADGAGWFNVPYSLPATPTTVAVASLVITTATLTRVYLPASYPWRFLRLNYSANTNVTLSAVAWIF